MKDCYKIKPVEELLTLLQSLGRQVFDGYQLSTNAGWVHQLGDGQIIFLSGTLRDPGLICDNKECFDRFIINLKLLKTKTFGCGAVTLYYESTKK